MHFSAFSLTISRRPFQVGGGRKRVPSQNVAGREGGLTTSDSAVVETPVLLHAISGVPVACKAGVAAVIRRSTPKDGGKASSLGLFFVYAEVTPP